MAAKASPQPEIVERSRWFIGHEGAHFWLGQTVRYAFADEAWITEGGADLMADILSAVAKGAVLLTGLGPGRKAEDLDDAMRQEQQAGDDPERRQGAGRPAIHLIEHSLSSPF